MGIRKVLGRIVSYGTAPAVPRFARIDTEKQVLVWADSSAIVFFFSFRFPSDPL